MGVLSGVYKEGVGVHFMCVWVYRKVWVSFGVTLCMVCHLMCGVNVCVGLLYMYSWRFLFRRWSDAILTLDYYTEVLRNSWNIRHTCRYTRPCTHVCMYSLYISTSIHIQMCTCVYVFCNLPLETSLS